MTNEKSNMFDEFDDTKTFIKYAKTYMLGRILEWGGLVLAGLSLYKGDLKLVAGCVGVVCAGEMLDSFATVYQQEIMYGRIGNLTKRVSDLEKQLKSPTEETK